MLNSEKGLKSFTCDSPPSLTNFTNEKENPLEMKEFILPQNDFSGGEENDLSCSMNSSENDEEAAFAEKSDLQNLISSLSEISDECHTEREKEARLLLDYDNDCSLESICGLHKVKETLLNIFIYPAVYPHLFPRKIRWNKILLYGPPGTGKSMLAKAIANEINATLHRISSSDLLSHWQGETEKEIRRLFENVRSSCEPTILFFDEIDGLCRKRTTVEDDSVRRIKTELLTQLDDFASEYESNQTYIIGATNCPWEIDSGFMRRFHKKIFIPLPDKKARLDILKKSFDEIKTELAESEWDEIGKSTEGYSGSDLVNIVMTSCCERFMQMKNSKYWQAKGNVWVPVTVHSLFTMQMSFEDIHPSEMGSRNIIFADLKAAIENTPKTVGQEELVKYLEFSSKIK